MMQSQRHLIKSSLLALVFCFWTSYCLGQEKALYYPEKPIVNNDDSLRYYLLKNHYAIDSNATTIKLWELGDVALTENFGPSVMNAQFNISTIIKFNTHEAVQDFSLDYLPMNLSRMPVTIQGTVYNLQDDKVVKQKFSFTPKDLAASNKYLKVPNLKTGSILDIKLECFVPIGLGMASALPAWHFDSNCPTLFSAYFIAFPIYFMYRNIMTASVPFKEVKTNEELTSGAATFIRANIDDLMTFEAWERKNIPAFKKEVMMPAPETFREKVVLQFTSIKVANGKPIKLMDDWSQISKRTYAAYPEFKSVFRNNRFLDKELDKITQTDSTPLQKAQSIYQFVRNSFTATDESYFDRTNKPFSLKKLLASRNGSDAEINLLLTAMMEKAGFSCNLVLVATKPNAPLSPDYPNTQQINAMVCYLKLDNREYFLDASDKALPFGLLRPEYYNGYSRILAKKPFAVTISADSVTNHTIIYAAIQPDSLNHSLALQLTEKLDNFAAYVIRKSAKGSKEKAEALLKTAYNSSDFEIQSVTIDSLANPDVPLKITYRATFPLPANKSNLYFPVFFDKVRDVNPFPDVLRKYPVDMGSRSSYSYYLRFRYPENYRIKGIPQPTELKLANDKAVFSAVVWNDSTNHLLSAKANFQSKSAEFEVSDYASLRSFWAEMLNQSNTNILIMKQGGH